MTDNIHPDNRVRTHAGETGTVLLIKGGSRETAYVALDSGRHSHFYLTDLTLLPDMTDDEADAYLDTVIAPEQEYFTRDELIARLGAEWVAEHLGPPQAQAHAQREYQFTTTATITAATQQEAWDEYFEWLSEPSNVEDGTEQVLLPAVDYTDFANAPKLADRDEPEFVGGLTAAEDEARARTLIGPLSPLVGPEYDLFVNGGTLYLDEYDDEAPNASTPGFGEPDGTEGQDRESYTDTQDRDEYTVPPTCILTGEDGENPDDCTTHDHEQRCVYCNKPVAADDHGVLVDNTGGDVCGSYGTYTNEPHVISGQANDPREGRQFMDCNECAALGRHTYVKGCIMWEQAKKAFPTERGYEVSVTKRFTATSPEDAAEQMADWLTDTTVETTTYKVTYTNRDGNSAAKVITHLRADTDD